jgi:7-carboxy-7-deazaguanine synthase
VRGSGTYLVREIFGPTIQGEGAHAGRACVFLRLAACNLSCTWCDTDFLPERSTRMTCAEIVARLLELDENGARLVIVTGGEPALQWDEELAGALTAAGFTAHMESNGTRPLRAPVDWLTISPKPQFHPASIALAPLSPSECKVVVDDAVDDGALAAFEARYAGCAHWFLQPCMDERYPEHLARTLDLVQRHPRWRLSVQLHKVIGVP